MKKLITPQTIKWLVIAFVILIPFADHTRFTLGFLFPDSALGKTLGRILPVRFDFILLTLVTFLLVVSKFGSSGLSFIKQQVRPLLTDKIFLLLSGLWLVRVVSISNSLNLRASIELLFFYSSMIILYMILKYLYQKYPKLPSQLLRTYVYVACVIAIYGLIQLLAYFLLHITLPGVLPGGNFIRVPGTFYDANHFPAYLASAAPILLSYAWTEKKKLLKMVYWIFFSLMIALILFTFSRSGMMAIAVGMYLMSYFVIRLKFYKKVIPLMLGLGLAAVLIYISAFTSKSLVERIVSVANTSDKSTNAHFLLYEGGIELFRDNPILGVGYGSFSEHFRSTTAGVDHSKIDPAVGVRIPAHSLWLEALAETGVLGITLFLILMTFTLMKIISFLQFVQNKEAKILATGLFASSVGLMVGAVFYSYNLEFFWFFLFNAYFISLLNIRRFQDGEIASEATQSEPLAWKEIIPAGVIIGSAVFLILYNLGATTLIEFDEAIYASVAKELSQKGDYFAMTLDGKLWFDKPPIYFWLTAPAVKLFIYNSFAVRIWPAIFGIGTVVLVYLLTRHLFGKLAAFFAGLILLSNVHFLYYTRNGITDGPVTFFITVTVFLFVLARKYPFLFIFSGLSLALAILTKGPVGLLLLPTLLLLSIPSWKDKKQRWYLLAFVIAFVGASVPWHIIEYLRFGEEFTKTYFGYHIFSRLSDPEFEGHSAGRWVYLNVIINGMRIWSPLALLRIPLVNIYLPGLALIWVLWKILTTGKLKIDLRKLWSDYQRLFLLGTLVWALVIFVTFTISESKLLWYILPLYPALAILGGYFVASFVNTILPKLPLSRLIKKQIPVIISLVALLISGGYLYHERTRFYPPDFNYDMVQLISNKNLHDIGKGTLTVFFNGNHYVQRYYSEGHIETFTPSNHNLMGERIRNTPSQSFYIIGPSSVTKSNLPNEQAEQKYNAYIVAQSGNLSLIYKRSL